MSVAPNDFTEASSEEREEYRVSDQPLELNVLDLESLQKKLFEIKRSGFLVAFRQKRVLREFAGASFRQAIEGHGFLAMKMPPKVKEAQANAPKSLDAFYALPQEIKNLFAARGGTAGSDGYISQENLIEQKAGDPIIDQKEFLYVDGLMDNWIADANALALLDIESLGLDPEITENVSRKIRNGEIVTVDDFVPGYSKNMQDARNAYEDTALTVLRLVEATYDLPAESLVNRMKGSEATNLGSVNYMPLKPGSKGQTLAKAHRDKSMMTFLKPGKGLQVLTSEGDEAVWKNIPVLDDVAFMNFGLQLTALTNGFVKSIPHRVVPVEGLEGNRRAMPVFFSLPYEDTLSPLSQFINRRGMNMFPVSLTARDMFLGTSDEFMEKQEEALRLNVTPEQRL